ncbi:MAG: nitroreductase [Firmicutes bacterium]|nr:nitroreductase [Bacillota bacterium]
MSNPVLDAIFSRRSIRAYSKEQITDEQLQIILTAGQAAPSARNLQPWHFTAVQDQRLIRRINEAFRAQMLQDCPPEMLAQISNPAYSVFFHAPTVIFFSSPGIAVQRYTETDTGIAIENMALAAHALGLGSVILGQPRMAFMGPEAEDLRRLLQFPAGYDFLLALSIGVPAASKDAHPVETGRVTIIR